MSMSQKSPLIIEPLSNHTVETRLAVMRAAISAGADVNALDLDPFLGYNEGRPLDACLNMAHMPGNADVRDNLPVIELLLEHGADPRFMARSIMISPLRKASFYAGQEGLSIQGKVFWDRVVAMFEEAIVRLEDNRGKKRGTFAAKFMCSTRSVLESVFFNMIDDEHGSCARERVSPMQAKK
ncbi:hypothetical protein N0V90_001768 [Kalmusia sp. IMI 367209]|nr:hypothetical protein N0V90_001768 [Kalmusia sp. IMI 367209]